MYRVIALTLFVVFTFLFSTVSAQKYSVFTLSLTGPQCPAYWMNGGGLSHTPYDYGNSTCEAYIDSTLEAVAEAGFNTISVSYSASFGTNPSHQAKDYGMYRGSNTDWRDAYKALFEKILNYDGGYSDKFNLMVRINVGAASLAYADSASPILWVDSNDNKFVKHAPIQDPTTLTPPKIITYPGGLGPQWAGGETWDPNIDMYEAGQHDTVPAARWRDLDYTNVFVRNLVKRIWHDVIDDAVEVAGNLGLSGRLAGFTLNTSTATTESEHHYGYFVGNDAFLAGLDMETKSDSIDAINQRQEELGELHGELSDIVALERDSAKHISGGFNFWFGAQWSGTQDPASLMRGTMDLAQVASHLNPGDWIHTADVADSVHTTYNHNFSTDYLRSVGSFYGLRVSNECSWPTFLENPPGTLANAAYLQQAQRSHQHGAQAFFLANWSDWLGGVIHLNNSVFSTGSPGSFVYEVANSFALSNWNDESHGENAIFFDPWAVYSTHTPVVYDEITAAHTISLYTNAGMKGLYDRLSSDGQDRVDIITSRMVYESPSSLDNYKRIYIPAFNAVISDNARYFLLQPQNKKKLTLESTSAGSLNKYQANATPLSHYIRSDLLWVDRNDKFPSDLPEEYPGYQVALSLGGFIDVATMWSGDLTGLTYSSGFLAGDFDGNGYDDVLDIQYNLNNFISLSNGEDGFDAPVQWDVSGNYAEYMRVGDFNGDGKDDLLAINGENLDVKLSNGSGFDSESGWLYWEGLGNTLGHYIGDFNGDGKDDFLNFSASYLFVATSNGASFEEFSYWGSYWPAEGGNVRVGDFNGDGMDDLLWVDSSNISGDTYPGLQVRLSTGSSFSEQTQWSDWGGLTSSFGYYVGDFNGDGKDDFMNFADDYDLEVVISNGSTNFTTLSNWGSWGADGVDLLVGNFGSIGGGLPKKGVPPSAKGLPQAEAKMRHRGGLLEFQNYSGKVEIYSLQGKKVMGGQVGHGNRTLDISRIPTGTYFVKAGEIKTRIMKQ